MAATVTRVVLLLALLQVFGCASAPQRVDRAITPERISAGEIIASAAQNQIGVPYRYGGASPQGFDCSGLVHYTHLQAGIAVPRSSEEQHEMTRPVPLSEIRRGDLLFFRVSRRKVSHVGIYDGNGRFIHAPSQGKKVSATRIDNPYWRKRIVGAGRFY